MKNLLNSISPNLRIFIWKVVIFSVLFIIVTGIVGIRIIPTRLLYGFHFFIYGNMGKMVLFSLIAFIILTRHRIKDLKNIYYNRLDSIFVFLSFILIPIFFYLSTLLLKEKVFYTNLPLSLLTHLIAILIPLTVMVGVFGIGFLKYFIKKYLREIITCAALSVVFYFAIFEVWKLWPLLSFIVMKSVAWILGHQFSPVKELGNLSLFVKTFSVRIEEACSGIDSIFLFSSLYILIALVDWKEFNKLKLFLTFFPALVGLFLVNILRVYLLILIGILFSPKLMFELFHTYLGMILFILYFGLFWKFLYKWIKK